MPMRSSEFDPDNYVVAGYLVKRGKYMGLWNERYFVLCDDALHWFQKSRESLFAKARGRWLCSKLRIISHPSARTFTLLFERYTTKLRALHNEDFPVWSNAFSAVIKERFTVDEPLLLKNVRNSLEINHSNSDLQKLQNMREQSCSPVISSRSSSGKDASAVLPASMAIDYKSHIIDSESLQQLRMQRQYSDDLLKNRRYDISKLVNSQQSLCTLSLPGIIRKRPRTSNALENAHDPLLVVIHEKCRTNLHGAPVSLCFSTNTIDCSGQEVIIARNVPWNEQLMLHDLQSGDRIRALLHDGTRVCFECGNMQSDRGEKLIGVDDPYRKVGVFVRWQRAKANRTYLQCASDFCVIAIPAIFISNVILLVISSVINSGQLPMPFNWSIVLLLGFISSLVLLYQSYNLFLISCSSSSWLFTFVAIYKPLNNIKSFVDSEPSRIKRTETLQPDNVSILPMFSRQISSCDDSLHEPSKDSANAALDTMNTYLHPEAALENSASLGELSSVTNSISSSDPNYDIQKIMQYSPTAEKFESLPDVFNLDAATVVEVDQTDLESGSETLNQMPQVAETSSSESLDQVISQQSTRTEAIASLAMIRAERDLIQRIRKRELPPMRHVVWGGWSDDDVSNVVIRGSTFLADKKKISCPVQYFKLIHVDLQQSNGPKLDRLIMRSSNFASEYYRRNGSMYSANDEHDVASTEAALLHPLIVINLFFPVENGYVSLACYYHRQVRTAGQIQRHQQLRSQQGQLSRESDDLGDDELDSMLDVKRVAAFDRNLLRYLDGDDAYRDSKFKIIARVVDGPWIVRKSVGSTPSILGRKLTQTHYYDRKRNIYELDVDVGSSVVAAKILSLVKSTAVNLTADISFLLQGSEQDELPEAFLGGVRIHHCDITKVPSIEQPSLNEPHLEAMC